MALQAPEALDPLAIDPPALAAQQGPDAAVAVAGMTGGELVHARDQRPLVGWLEAPVALARAVLANHSAGPTLRDPPALLEEADGVTTARRAHQFPRCRSFKSEMSSACSATIFFRREFSCSSAFSRWTSSSFSAP